VERGIQAEPHGASRTGDDGGAPQITGGCLSTRYGTPVAELTDSPAMPAAPWADASFPPILTTAQAAELLQVHVEYLRKMVREDRIPAHRFPGGREIRFHRNELIQWVKEQPGHDRSPSAEERVEH